MDIEIEIFPLLIQDEYAKYFSPSSYAKAYKTELYKKMQTKVSNQIKIGEDGACTITCVYNAKSLYITDIVTYYYRQNSTSITKNKKPFDMDGPRLIYEHIQKEINLKEYSFEQQLYRKTVHELFTVAVSQFYRDDNYGLIIKEIKEKLKDPIYVECIKKSKFKSLKGKLALMALKYKMFWLIKLYSMLHSF